MNQDVRKDHTMRNALLLATGIAGGVGGGMMIGAKSLAKSVSKAEKNAVKTAKDVVETAGKDTERTVKNKAEDIAKDNSSTIKNKADTTTARTPVTPADIARYEAIIKDIEAKLTSEKNPIKVKQLQKELEAIKGRVARLKLGGS